MELRMHPGDLPERRGDDPETASIRARGLERAVEALLFAAEDPLPAQRLAEVFAEVSGEAAPDRAEVEAAVERLNALYEASDRTFRIERWAGGYRLATVPTVAPYLKVHFRNEQQRRLSRSLLETLAVVAYRQPVTRPEIDFVRGVDSDYTVRRLMELGFVDVVGRSESLGRPLLYGTTARFLEQFGLDSLEELPNLREIEDILNDPAFNRERARLLELDVRDPAAPGTPTDPTTP